MRSPKPRVVGSIPTAHATTVHHNGLGTSILQDSEAMAACNAARQNIWEEKHCGIRPRRLSFKILYLEGDSHNERTANF